MHGPSPPALLHDPMAMRWSHRQRVAPFLSKVEHLWPDLRVRPPPLRRYGAATPVCATPNSPISNSPVSTVAELVLSRRPMTELKKKVSGRTSRTWVYNSTKSPRIFGSGRGRHISSRSTTELASTFVPMTFSKAAFKSVIDVRASHSIPPA